MKTKIVSLRKYFSNSISTRAAIENIFDFNLSNLKSITYDFTEINFISSSAAHQFVLELEKIDSNRIEVTLTNIVDDVQKMLDLSRSDRKNLFTTQKIDFVTVTSNKDLESILL